MNASRRLQSGFSIVELAVVLTVIALMAMIAVPSFGKSTRTSRERGVVQQLTQDFAWARGAAAAGDASTLLSSLSGAPTVTMTLRADCSWAVTVNGTTIADHSMTSANLATAAPAMSCSGSLALPATFTFTARGLVDTSGTITYTGGSAQAYPLQIFSSGTMVRLSPVAGTQS